MGQRTLLYEQELCRIARPTDLGTSDIVIGRFPKELSKPVTAQEVGKDSKPLEEEASILLTLLWLSPSCSHPRLVSISEVTCTPSNPLQESSANPNYSEVREMGGPRVRARRAHLPRTPLTSEQRKGKPQQRDRPIRKRLDNHNLTIFRCENLCELEGRIQGSRPCTIYVGSKNQRKGGHNNR